MRFSKLKDRITILKPINENKNFSNEKIVEYIPFKTVWGLCVPMSGREYEEAQKIRAETTYNVYIRYIGVITSDMRIQFGNQTLEIVSCINLNSRNKELRIVAKEVDNNGKKC